MQNPLLMDTPGPHNLVVEPYETYASLRDTYLSSHSLATVLSNPLLYAWRKSGAALDQDSQAYAFGRAAHTHILEGYDRFLEEYAVGGPINDRTGKPYGQDTRTWEEWLLSSGKKAAVSFADLEKITLMHNAVRGHPVASSILASGQPELTARGTLHSHGRSFQVQARCDWLDIGNSTLADLKTCHSLDEFEADALKYGYPFQLAFYAKVLGATCGIRHLSTVALIAVEKKEPYRVGVWRLSQETLTHAHGDVYAALGTLATCLETNTWPTGYEDIREL
jgi:hypothetical protein